MSDGILMQAYILGGYLGVLLLIRAAFELRHWWQFQSGTVRVHEIKPVWLGFLGCTYDVTWERRRVKLRRRSFNDYLNLPWEIDARRWSWKVGRRLNLRTAELREPTNRIHRRAVAQALADLRR